MKDPNDYVGSVFVWDEQKVKEIMQDIVNFTKQSDNNIKWRDPKLTVVSTAVDLGYYIMKYKEGDRLRVITPVFQKIFAGHNVWIVDHIKTQTEPYPSLYICYRENDEHKTLYNFLEEEVVKEIRNLEEIQNSITQ